MHINTLPLVYLSGEAEGWTQSKRGVDYGFSWGGGGAFFMAGAEDASPAPNLPGLWLHAATLYRVPT